MTKSEGSHEYTIPNSVFVGFVVFLVVAVSAPFMMFPTEPDPRHVACHDFAKHMDGLSVEMCVDYLETNPDSTGRQMLDHYSIRLLDDILDEPVVPDV